MTREQAVKEAAQAHTTLVLFETAAMILEGSDVHGDAARRTAAKIVGTLRLEQGRLLRTYDRMTRAALEAHSND